MCGLKTDLIALLLLIIAFAGCASINNQSPTGAKDDSRAKAKTIRVSAPDSDSAEPSVAAGGDGTIFVVCVEHAASKKGDVILRRYDAEGRAKGEPARVNPKAGEATAWRGDPPTIKIGDGGAIFVGWTARIENEKGTATTLYLSVSRDGGLSFEPPVKVNDDTAPASHGMHSLAVDAAGRIYFAWLDERYLNARGEKAFAEENPPEEYRFEKTAFFHHKPEAETETESEPNSELYFAVSSDGGKTFSANKRLAENTCPCCKTSLLAATDGRVYVSWRQVLNDDFRHIAVASSKDGGDNFSTPVIVSDDRWQINACPVSGAALGANSDGSLTVAWFTAGSAGKQGFYFSESKDGGKTFSPRALISENAAGGTPLLIQDETKNNRVFWNEAGKIFTAKLQSGNSQVEDKGEVTDGEFPSAAFAGNRFFVAYTGGEKERRDVELCVLK